MKECETQTDEASRECFSCSNKEHLILQRQAYIWADAYGNTMGTYHEPITSREDRTKMDISNRSSYNKWIHKFKLEMQPRSPRDFTKNKSLVIFNNPEIKITSKEAPKGTTNIRKPRALTIGNEVYEAICSRKPTCPALATSHRKILLPSPRKGKWSYTTTQF